MAEGTSQPKAKMVNHHRSFEILRILEQRYPGSYLVGGAVRDALLGRPWESDLDVVVHEDGFAAARWITSLRPGEGSFVPLDDERGTGRVVFRWGMTLDISRRKGATVNDDLLQRDFTVNAIAVTLTDFFQSGWSQLIDPLGGVTDLHKGILRLCSPGALLDDPLRILRAFRLRATHEMHITRDTIHLLKEALPFLQGVAAERLRDELFLILFSERATPILRQMDETGVVDILFPELIPMKGCTQNTYHHLDVWNHTMEVMESLEKVFLGDPRFPEDLQDRIQVLCRQELVRGRPKSSLLKFAGLFHDAGKPLSRSVDGKGNVHFYHHERLSRQIVNSVGLRMKLAFRERELIGKWVEAHLWPLFMLNRGASRRSVIRMCRTFGGDVFGLFLLVLADLAAKRGPARSPGEQEQGFLEMVRAMEICREWEQSPPPRLLTGKDVLLLFHVSPGPLVGELLRYVEELHDAGEIATKEEAIAKAREFLNQRL